MMPVFSRLAGMGRWMLVLVLAWPMIGCASHEDQVTREFMFVPSMPQPPDPVMSADAKVPLPTAPIVETSPLPPPDLTAPPAPAVPLVPPSKAVTGNVNPGGKGK
jgi:hypothetical protein